MKQKHVSFLNLFQINLRHKQEIQYAINEVLETGKFIIGEQVIAFEKEFAAFCHAKHCIGVGNGLDAPHLILRAMDIKHGEEVIVPANTFIATWLAVTQIGAIPVPVEPVEQTYNINPQKIASAITSKTRAILAVHLYGQPADMKTINQIARQYGLYLIEDAAQAHGAKYYGDLRVKLRFLKKDNKLRQKLALYYCNHIKNDQITIPFVPEKMEPVWHLFVIRHSERDAMQIKLKAMGGETLIHYPSPLIYQMLTNH